jgi:hypothetical protein
VRASIHRIKLILLCPSLNSDKLLIKLAEARMSKFRPVRVFEGGQKPLHVGGLSQTSKIKLIRYTRMQPTLRLASEFYSAIIADAQKNEEFQVNCSRPKWIQCF